MSEVNQKIYLPSLYGFRLAIGYFRVVKCGGQCYPRFPPEYGGHVLSLPNGFLYQKFSLVRFAGRSQDCSPQTPWSYADARVCKELKLVWFGDIKIQFWVLGPGISGACLAGVFFDILMIRCVDRRTRRRSLVLVFWFVGLCWVRLCVPLLLKVVDVNSWSQ